MSARDAFNTFYLLRHFYAERVAHMRISIGPDVVIGSFTLKDGKTVDETIPVEPANFKLRAGDGIA